MTSVETVRMQAIELLEQICVHDASLPLRRLRDLLPGETPDFYESLLRIFAEFGDRHTHCQLPAEYMRTLVFLPFALDTFEEDGQLRYGVTGSALKELRPGDVVTAWNGRSVTEVIEEHAAIQLGANPEARRAKALQTLTFRPLGTMPRPAERNVTITYRNAEARESSLEVKWRNSTLNEPLYESEPAYCWAQEGNLKFRAFHTRYGEFGWIRIASLYEEPARFLSSFVRCLQQISPRGVVIDLRGCEEGFVTTAEQLLQLFTDRMVVPAPFEFRITPVICQIIEKAPALAPWRGAIRTGGKYSAGRPVTSPEQANNVGRKYFGPVVALSDSLTYSSAEIFAAGLQDHGIGAVFCTSARTGGGGASPWSQQVIWEYTGREDLRPLSDGPCFRVAARRCRRTERNEGVLIEALGVTPDVTYRITRRDFYERDSNLSETLGEFLAKGGTQR